MAWALRIIILLVFLLMATFSATKAVKFTEDQCRVLKQLKIKTAGCPKPPPPPQ